MSLTLNDWMFLVGMLSAAAWASYTAHEVQNAIHSYLHGDENDL